MKNFGHIRLVLSVVREIHIGMHTRITSAVDDAGRVLYGQVVRDVDKTEHEYQLRAASPRDVVGI